MVGTEVACRDAMRHLQTKILRRAAEIVGGEAELAALLCVDSHRLRLWLTGRASTPTEVLNEAVDLVVEDDIARAAQDRRATPRDALITQLTVPAPS